MRPTSAGRRGFAAAILSRRSAAPELTYDRYISEVTAKEKAVDVARLEKDQSDVMVDQHRITSPIHGQVKSIFRRRGEAVKGLETVFQIQNLEVLRIEGQVDIQYRSRLRPGMKVYVEPSLPISSVAYFPGHLQEITAVAVSNDAKNPQIVSASEDNTVRVWEGRQRREKAIFVHPQAVRAVACTPAGAAANLCLTGCGDGKLRLYDLAGGGDQPIREFGKSGQPINCVAFSPDGKTCASGGEDREINLWDVASGSFLYRLPTDHRGAITSLQFLPQSQLISTGRDRNLVLWQLGESGAKKIRAFENRNGDVSTLGASPDGKFALFDQGRTLRVMTLPGGLTEAVLQGASSASSFATLAIWSPDGQRILTGSAGDGRLNLCALARHRQARLRAAADRQRRSDAVHLRRLQPGRQLHRHRQPRPAGDGLAGAVRRRPGPGNRRRNHAAGRRPAGRRPPDPRLGRGAQPGRQADARRHGADGDLSGEG